MRSCNAMIGSCRISIDWIIRGASLLDLDLSCFES